MERDLLVVMIIAGSLGLEICVALDAVVHTIVGEPQ